ncbi:MAG TPA: hypothetical protein VIR33_16820 [Thermopolyspora sp.]|jgi:hypothetical protein
MLKAFLRKIRFLLYQPGGYLADGRMIGLGMGTAMKSYGSAEDAERHLRRWAADERVGNESRAQHGPRR